MTENDLSQQLESRVQQAFHEKTPLRIRGGGSKSFYARPVTGETMDVSEHQGIQNYEPTELVITARAGTPLQQIRQTLADNRQLLPFEPPAFGDGATIGGTVACNFSGPMRAYSGAARDFVLGCRIINGKGEILSFGGEVMKNVAGYDVSRLMCGALGSLGVLLDISLKVIPVSEQQQTLVLEQERETVLKQLHQWSRHPFPITASTYVNGKLYLRFSGTPSSLDAAREHIGGEVMQGAETFWESIREQTHDFFHTDTNLWRISLPNTAPPLPLEGQWLYEWGGALRWLVSNAPVDTIRKAVAQHQGHATLFRSKDRIDAVFHPLDSGLMQIHRRLKQSFDPENILNPGVMYADL